MGKDTEQLLIIAGLGAAIYLIYNLRKGVQGLGEGLSGIGEGAGTIARETGETFQGLTDFTQAGLERARAEVFGNKLPFRTPKEKGTIEPPIPPGDKGAAFLKKTLFAPFPLGLANIREGFIPPAQRPTISQRAQKIKAEVLKSARRGFLTTAVPGYNLLSGVGSFFNIGSSAKASNVVPQTKKSKISRTTRAPRKVSSGGSLLRFRRSYSDVEKAAAKRAKDKLTKKTQALKFTMPGSTSSLLSAALKKYRS